MRILRCVEWADLADTLGSLVLQENSKTRSTGKDTYKLTSTVMLWLETNKDDSGMMKLGGSLTRQDEREIQYDEQVSGARRETRVCDPPRVSGAPRTA